jgi:hypothetical protein
MRIGSEKVRPRARSGDCRFLFRLSSLPFPLKCCPDRHPDVSARWRRPHTVRGMEVDPRLLVRSGRHGLTSSARRSVPRNPYSLDWNSRSKRTTERAFLKINTFSDPLWTDSHKSSRKPSPTTCGTTSTPSRAVSPPGRGLNPLGTTSSIDGG